MHHLILENLPGRMSSVFLSNVDDYLGPSQACVNPLFSTDKEAPKQPAEESNPESAGKVIPRRRRKRVIPGESSSGPRIPVQPKEQDIVKASISDCLACSGCVTTAETVLLEERHSLETLRALMDQPTHPEIVMTISPASWADLLRHLNTDGDILQRQRQLTTLLQQTMSVAAVMDGNVALEWSRQEAALEFCRAWRQKHDESMMEEDGAATLPLISSSCPATVCLVEKSIHKAVPHLATTKSPMSAAGAFWRSLYAPMTNGNKPYFHLAVMPCHDKKLEASRSEFAHGAEDPDVNMVITTQECFELIQQRWKGGAALDLNIMPLAPVYADVSEWKQAGTCSLIISKNATPSKPEEETSFAVDSSGAYADYIFRYAAKELFGVTIGTESIWTRVVDRSNTQKVSVRVAAQRRREFYQAALYTSQDGSYSTSPSSPDSAPVLCFAVAYGMQTMQRSLQPFQEDYGGAPSPFHYIEAMACPSGCINGGGQLRVAPRETPTETRQRVAQSRQWFVATTPEAFSDQPPPSDLHTHYRVIAPLQHSLGAAAGVAVRDTQW